MLLKCIQAGGPLITLPLGTGCWQMFCGAHQAAQHWKDKQGSVCSILGGWVAVGILSLPIPGQPGLTTILEWKALSLSWLMTLPGCHLPGTFCGLILLSRRYSAKTSQEREQLVEQVRTGVGKGCGLRAPVHSIPGARYKAADPCKGFPFLLAP